MAENIQEMEILTRRIENAEQVMSLLMTSVNTLSLQVKTLVENGALSSVEAPKTNGRAGRHTPIHVLDTKTNKVYRTQAEAGMAVAPEYGLAIHNFVWYELVKGTKNKPAKCPDRFTQISEDEYQERLAEQNAPEPEPEKVPQPQGKKS